MWTGSEPLRKKSENNKMFSVSMEKNTSNQEISFPKLSCGVIGNTSGFGPEEFRFET